MSINLKRIVFGALLGVAAISSALPASAYVSSGALRQRLAGEIYHHCTEAGVFPARYFDCLMLSTGS